MPNTVAQHAVATFTSPVNGSSPIDANTVRGNDNTTRTSYNNHDADPGIHVQSSTLASRPVAGTAGRKWITADAGSYKLWYDDGTTWHEVANTGVDVFVVASEILAKGDVIKVTGYNNGLNAPIVAKVSSASDTAFGIVTGAISNGGTGYITNTGLIADVNTNAFAIGTTLYPNTSGGFTSTKPVAGTYQPVAYVLRSNTNNGVLYVEFSAPRIVERSDNTVSTLVLRDASGNFAAGTITANLTGNISGTAPAGTLTGSTLASGVTASSLTSVGTLTALTVSSSIRSTGSSGVASASTGVFDYVAGTTTRIISYGPNTSTPGAFQFLTLSSDASAGDIRATIASNGNVAFDTNTLFVDAVNNRVGVGTASPENRLSVSGVAGIAGVLSGGATLPSTSHVYASTLRLGVRGSLMTSDDSSLTTVGTYLCNNVFFKNASGNPAYLTTNPASAILLTDNVTIFRRAASGTADTDITFTESARIDASGNLGLGVTPSAWGGAITQVLQLGRGVSLASQNTANVAYLFSNAYFDGAFKYVGTGTATAYVGNNDTGEHQWRTAPSGTAGNAISFTQAMTLDASGNLGLGSGRFIVSNATSNAGTTDISLGAYVGGAWLNTPSATQGWLAVNGAGVYRWASDSHIWYMGGTERARITSGGDFGIGETSPTGIGSSYRNLVLKGTSGSNIDLNDATGTVRGTISTDSSGGNAMFIDTRTAHPIIFRPNTQERMRIDNTTTAGQTALLLWDVDNGTMERVTVGAADSGGTGFKVLRIPN